MNFVSQEADNLAASPFEQPSHRSQTAGRTCATHLYLLPEAWVGKFASPHHSKTGVGERSSVLLAPVYQSRFDLYLSPHDSYPSHLGLYHSGHDTRRRYVSNRFCRLVLQIFPTGKRMFPLVPKESIKQGLKGQCRHHRPERTVTRAGRQRGGGRERLHISRYKTGFSPAHTKCRGRGEAGTNKVNVCALAQNPRTMKRGISMPGQER